MYIPLMIPRDTPMHQIKWFAQVLDCRVVWSDGNAYLQPKIRQEDNDDSEH